MTPSQQFYDYRLDEHLELLSKVPLYRTVNTEDLERSLQFSSWKRGLEGTTEKRPLCLIFGWFAGERKHLVKFANLYLDQGFDVLVAKNQARELFTPKSTLKSTARQTLAFLCQNRNTYDSIVIHGFSIGATVWGQILRMMDKNPLQYGFLREKVRFQVWDSPFVDIERLPKVGSSTVFRNDAKLQKIVENLVTFHMNVLGRAGPRYYERPFHVFRTKNLKTPCLLYTSENDESSLVSMVAGCAEAWQRNGSAVYWKVWKSSRHVCHMRDNPDEYKALLKLFLDSVGLLKYPYKLYVSNELTSL